MKQEIHYFFVAISFFTRIPIRLFLGFKPDDLNKSTKYFPYVGIIVGTLTATVFHGVHHYFSVHISIAISMVFSILLTGGFHEDGLADVCDSFGGAYTKEDVLRIMKDSRLGTFGTIGLISVLGIKFLALSEINPNQIQYSLVVAHILSRFPVLFLMKSLPYVQDIDLSKMKPIATKISFWHILFGFIPCLILIIYSQLYIQVIYISFIYFFSHFWFKRKIGGYTGDCLGTNQQLTEVAIYLSFLL